jgi:hypothetical protein
MFYYNEPLEDWIDSINLQIDRFVPEESIKAFSYEIPIGKITPIYVVASIEKAIKSYLLYQTKEN